jgi:hypothetical protein
LKEGGLLSELCIAHRGKASFLGVDQYNDLAEFSKDASFACTQNLVYKRWHRPGLSVRV